MACMKKVIPCIPRREPSEDIICAGTFIPNFNVHIIFCISGQKLNLFVPVSTVFIFVFAAN